MLSRSQVIRQAQDLGVEHAEELSGAASAAWRLRACRGQEVAAAVVGGHPLYLDDGEWPVNEHGARLSLIVRVDCARMSPLRFGWPPAPGWEHRGARLDIFADRDFGDPTVSVVQRPARDGFSDLEAGVACAAVPCISLPTLPDEVFDDDFDAREAYERWRRLVAYDNAPPASAEGISTLLGSPHSIHDNVLETAAWRHGADGPTPAPGLDVPERWQVLLHLATDPDLGFEFGGGALTILAPGADLAAGRYDRAFAIWQF